MHWHIDIVGALTLAALTALHCIDIDIDIGCIDIGCIDIDVGCSDIGCIDIGRINIGSSDIAGVH